MRTRLLTVLLTGALALAACGGGGSGSESTTAATSGATGPGGALAALGIISKDTTVRPGTTTTFRDGNDGETLGQGDTIRTSATGFAELAYFDGSFTRIDNAAELTLTKLEKTDNTRNVQTTLASGRSWNRVSKATTATDTYTVDTPVATASVRGTAFQIDCTPTTHCRFSVIEGTIALTIPGRDDIILTAPAQIDITKDTAHTTTPRTVTLTELLADPFTTRNLQIDTTKNLPPITTPSTTTAATTTTGATTTTTTTPTTTSGTGNNNSGNNGGGNTATTQPPPPPPAAANELGGTWNVTYLSATIVGGSGCWTRPRPPRVDATGIVVVECGYTYRNGPVTFGCRADVCSADPGRSGGAIRWTLTALPDGGVRFSAPTPSCFPGAPAIADVGADAPRGGFTAEFAPDVCGTAGGQLVLRVQFSR